jgi:hypothetical protein
LQYFTLYCMLSDISIYSGSLRDRQSARRGTPKNGRGEGGKILGRWIVGGPFWAGGPGQSAPPYRLPWPIDIVTRIFHLWKQVFRHYIKHISIKFHHKMFDDWMDWYLQQQRLLANSTWLGSSLFRTRPRAFCFKAKPSFLISCINFTGSLRPAS